MNRETIPIAYEIEQTDAGWVVWRRLLPRPGWTGDERALGLEVEHR